MRLPELVGLAHGVACAGPHPCCFCGAAAARPYALPDSFTARDTLARPGSPWLCGGCAVCLQEAGVARYPDGTIYPFTKAFRRMLTHVVTAGSCVVATKAHTAWLRGVCLDPPDPPFGISVAVSGQKHVLYRGVVCHSREAVSLTLEGERIDYRPAELRGRLELAGRVCAATGKPALAETPGVAVWQRVCDRYAAGEAICGQWCRVWREPLSRLAAFLSPPKEGCACDYPGDRLGGVPAEGGRAGRPDAQAHGGGGDAQRARARGATLFGDV